MRARRYLRGAFDLGRAVAEELAGWASAKVIGWLFQAPEIREPGNPGFQVEPEDDEEELTEPSADQLRDARAERESMVRARRPKPEDNPPNEPLVGSLEWRNRQRTGRASR